MATNLTIKNAAAADKTFTLYSPAAGDNSVAMWKLKEGTVSGVFPTVTHVARATGNQSRRTQLKVKVPSSYTDASSGLTQVGPAFEFDGYVTVPDAFPESQKDDAVAYATNAFALAVMKAAARDGLPIS